MAVQSLIQQTIIFISPSFSFDEEEIKANGLIQTLKANSLGNTLLYGYLNYENANGSSSMFSVTAFIQPSFQATVQANIPALQAQLPQYTIATWGINTQFGN